MKLQLNLAKFAELNSRACFDCNSLREFTVIDDGEKIVVGYAWEGFRSYFFYGCSAKRFFFKIRTFQSFNVGLVGIFKSAFNEVFDARAFVAILITKKFNSAFNFYVYCDGSRFFNDGVDGVFWVVFIVFRVTEIAFDSKLQREIN